MDVLGAPPTVKPVPFYCQKSMRFPLRLQKSRSAPVAIQEKQKYVAYPATINRRINELAQPKKIGVCSKNQQFLENASFKSFNPRRRYNKERIDELALPKYYGVCPKYNESVSKNLWPQLQRRNLPGSTVNSSFCSENWENLHDSIATTRSETDDSNCNSINVASVQVDTSESSVEEVTDVRGSVQINCDLIIQKYYILQLPVEYRRSL